MRFMLQVRADRDTEAGVMPSKTGGRDGAVQRRDDQGRRHARGDGLHPSAKGARVSFAGGKPSVIEPPFADPTELIAVFGSSMSRRRKHRSDGRGARPSRTE